MSTPKRKVIIVKNDETFIPSLCECSFCKQMHNAQVDWKTFIPSTYLQQNMIHVISKLENKYK